MDKELLYEAANYAKFGNDLRNDLFQLDSSVPDYARFNGINLSGLFTLLIKEAGRLCDSYASDMFYDLKWLEKDLVGDNSVLFTQDTYTKIIGIRESGVDHENFMLSRGNTTDGFTYHYREIFLIDIRKEENHCGLMKLSCYRVSPSSMDYYINKKTERSLV